MEGTIRRTMDGAGHTRVLLVGAGLHRQLDLPLDSPFCSWTALLRRVALRRGVRNWSPTGSDHAVAWEDLVLQLVERSQGGRTNGRRKRPSEACSARQAEKQLQNSVSEVLGCTSEPCAALKGPSGRPVVDAIQRLRALGPLHIIDFNFDTVLMSHLDVKPRAGKVVMPRVQKKGDRLPSFHFRADDLENLFRRFPVGRDGRCWLWKPHGHACNANSIRMGMRDYGLQPAMATLAFSEFKAAEARWKRQYPRDRMNAIDQGIKDLDLSSAPKTWANNWMTRVLACECWVIGLSISDAEWGLRWVLNQRARNYARRDGPAAVMSGVRRHDVPAGVQSKWCDSWAAAWNGIGTPQRRS